MEIISSDMYRDINIKHIYKYLCILNQYIKETILNTVSDFSYEESKLCYAERKRLPALQTPPI